MYLQCYPANKKESIRLEPEFAYPFLGTDEERKQYILYFNKILQQKCKAHNFTFFDVYNHYVDAEGFLCKELSDGSIHIKKWCVYTEIYRQIFTIITSF